MGEIRVYYKLPSRWRERALETDRMRLKTDEETMLLLCETT